MSRYTIPVLDEKHEVVVGWDAPLNTFFVQVYDHSIENEDEQLVIWEGAMPPRIHNLDFVVATVKPFTPSPHIPADVLKNLLRDSD